MLSKKISIESVETKTKLNLPSTYIRLWIELVSGTVKVYLNDDTAYDELTNAGDAFSLPTSPSLKNPHTDEVYIYGIGVINVEYESELI